MTESHSLDEHLVQRLPLPLAQIYRRAHNAKTARDRHDTAYYLWESALKLLGSAAVVSFLQAGRTPDARLAGVLENLARPAVGHWWALVRALTVELADGDTDFAKVRDLLLGRARDDLPRVAGLDAALVAVLDGKGGGRSTVRLTELFDRLVRYRNQEIGHGAVGQRPARHYDDMGRALLAGLPQLLERLDVLAGRRLVYLADVRRLPSGAWLIERYELAGEAARRLESLERTHEEAAGLLPQQVYLAGAALLPLHPLLAYDFEANEFLFLNARRGKQRVEYLCYTSGRPVDRVQASAQNALLARLLDMPVDDARREQWQARSHAEEPTKEEHQPHEARRTLGEFELLSELGRGGMGVVYRAWQPSLGRQVALKSLLKSGDARAEKRFAREIAALGHVEHRHLVRIFTSGSEGDRWFYAMELIEGTTLATVCDHLSASGSSAGDVDLATWRQAVSTACEEARRGEKPLSDSSRDVPAEGAPPDGTARAVLAPARTGRAYVRHVVELMRQTAEAAHALHEKGVIHRDIKPGNIMIGADGARATLMDLGLAQVADETEGRLTRTRQFVGTLRYSSPEQVLAAARLDRRSDLYSLGATLWELLTLRPLFGATDETPTPDLMQKIQIEEPGRVRRHNPAVPRDLSAIVEKCLQKDAKRRYATAAELAGELSAFLAGRPVQARPVGSVERLGRWCRRNPVVAGLLALVAVLLLGGTVVATYYAVEAEARREAIYQKERADRKAAEAEANLREALKQKEAAEAARLKANAEKERADRKAAEAATSAGEAQKARREADRQHLRAEWLVYAGQISLAQREWEAGHREEARALLDSCRWDFRGWEHDYLYTLFNHNRRTVLEHADKATSVAFSPDGTRIASGSYDKTVKVWDVATGKEVLSLKGHSKAVGSVAFSPDGQRIASGSYDKTVKVWDAQTGKETLTLKGHTHWVRSVAFSLDGKRIAGVTHDTVKVWNSTTGQENLSLKGSYSVVFSPDGKRIATPLGDTVVVRDAATGKEIFSTEGREDTVLRVAFSPDGTRIASISKGDPEDSGKPGEVKVWDAATGKEVFSLKGYTNLIHPELCPDSVAFSPDGTRIAGSSYYGTVKLWDAQTSQEALTLKGPTDYVESVAFSPDGKHIAGVSGESVIVWDAHLSQEVVTLKGCTSSVIALAFSPDGTRLASTGFDFEWGGRGHWDAKVWDALLSRELLPLQLSSTTSLPISMAFSPDSKRIVGGVVVSTPDDSRHSMPVKVWDAQTGQETLTFKGDTGGVVSVAFSPDGKRVAGGTEDKRVKVWDAGTGKELLDLKGHTDIIYSVAFSPDGKRIVSGSGDGTVRVWHAQTGQEVLALKGHTAPVRSVAFSPDGRRILAACIEPTEGVSGDLAVKMWDARTGKEALSLILKGGTDRFSSVAFSPDGKRIVTGSGDGTVRVWNAATGREVFTLKGHTQKVESVAFSPDGKRIASGSDDKTVRIWHLPAIKKSRARSEKGPP